MPMLSAADHAFFEENGYVVVPNVVQPHNLDALVQTIWDFLGMDPNDPEDWYRQPLHPGGFLEMYQNQALWDNRQSPRVHQAFSELFGTEKLWVSIDRAGMKPPVHSGHPEYDHTGDIHWDCDTSRPRGTLQVQGVLYLTDTTEDQGGFRCVPGIFKNWESWLKTQPADRDPYHPDLTGQSVVPIPGKAGDLVIWHQYLAHGNGRNISERPRLAQYITMSPVPENVEPKRSERIAQWRDLSAPGGGWAPGDWRGWEQKNCEPAVLTPLGRRLLGLDSWEAPVLTHAKGSF